MAKLKLNQFHWQLADESKWRIELKKDSLLIDKSSFYTQAQIKEILKYAQERLYQYNSWKSVYRVLQKIYIYKVIKISLTRFAPYFGPYIHIGNSLTDTATIRYLSSKNKKIIGTDNLLFDNEIMTSYKSSKNGWSEAEKGNDVIMAPRQSCSLDYYQDWDDEKKIV